MEIWDLYNKNLEVIGEHIRGTEMPEDGYHLVVHIWIRNSEGEYLMTQRSAKKKTYPLAWECVGGSVLKGEESLHAALREVHEEVGIVLKPEEGRKVLTQIRDFAGDVRVNDINDVYLFDYDGPVSLSQATTDEVAQVKWMRRHEIKELYKKGEMVRVIKDLSYFMCGEDVCWDTLYVSDLDGTLMRSDCALSKNTIDIINDLTGKGLAFTFATARSIESAIPITGELRLKLPVITRNGAVLADNTTGKHLEKALFTEKEVKMLKELLPELPKYGFVSCFLGEEMHRLYIDGEHSPELDGYIDYYTDNPTVRPVATVPELFCGEPGYVTLVGAKEEISPIYERVKVYDGWECLFQKDTYRDEYWLEICPQNCTKAKTILKLKNRYGFKRLVVFGDGLNDIPMFKAADECYAVANALREVKQIATGVIGSNEEDAVAEFLKQRMEDYYAVGQN